MAASQPGPAAISLTSLNRQIIPAVIGAYKNITRSKCSRQPEDTHITAL